MWTAILETLISSVGVENILASIGIEKILPWMLEAAKFFGKTFLSKMHEARADDEDVQSFLRQQIVYEEASHPDINGFQRACNIATSQATKEYLKAIGKDLGGSLLGTAIAECHQFIEPILPDLVSVWLATGVMPSKMAVQEMLAQKAAQPTLPSVQVPVKEA